MARKAAEPELPEKVLAIHEQLAGSKLAHGFGGALALAYYAEPRATIDIDLNVFVPPSDCGRAAGALAPLGIGGDPSPAAVERDGQCRLWWGRTPVDLFFAYDALHDAMRKSLRKQPFAGTSIPILAPEHLIICKAIFDRPKDWIDIERMLLIADPVDAAEVRTWLERAVGPDDPRCTRATELLGRH